jgi:hypothetical protein
MRHGSEILQTIVKFDLIGIGIRMPIRCFPINSYASIEQTLQPEWAH